MPLSKNHKAQTREKILGCAGQLFRDQGYDGVGIDAIMASAGLTRGGFYAHFSSKADLFAAVLSENHDLLRRLVNRSEITAEDQNQAGIEILTAYLDPANFRKVSRNCSFTALSGDAARAEKPARDGYTNALRQLRFELTVGDPGRTDSHNSEQPLLIMSLAIGALTLARTSNDSELTTAILNSAQRQIKGWMSSAK